jgi:hypothetical protein
VGPPIYISNCQIYLVLFVYKFFIYNLFACLICSASGSGSGAANECPNASERGGGRQLTGRGRGSLAAWFRL